VPTYVLGLGNDHLINSLACFNLIDEHILLPECMKRAQALDPPPPSVLPLTPVTNPAEEPFKRLYCDIMICLKGIPMDEYAIPEVVGGA
jgi:hypothetical protein